MKAFSETKIAPRQTCIESSLSNFCDFQCKSDFKNVTGRVRSLCIEAKLYRIELGSVIRLVISLFFALPFIYFRLNIDRSLKLFIVERSSINRSGVMGGTFTIGNTDDVHLYSTSISAMCSIGNK